jgi:hypothetical protein
VAGPLGVVVFFLAPVWTIAVSVLLYRLTTATATATATSPAPAADSL